jgi:hypothetical protein
MAVLGWPHKLQAEVAEWQTQRIQNPPRQPLVKVRVLSSAQLGALLFFSALLFS